MPNQELDLPAILADIEMAGRSPEMAKHVALDHAPQLVEELLRLRLPRKVGSQDDSGVRLIDPAEYAVMVLWRNDGECIYGGNGDIAPIDVPASLRKLADLIETDKGEVVKE